MKRTCSRPGARWTAVAAALCAAQALAYAAGEPLVARSTRDEPLVGNLSFEQGEECWGVWGDSDLREEYYGVKPYDGATFLRLWKRSGWYQDFPTQPGHRYIVSAYVNTASKDPLRGDAYGEVKVEWRNKTEADVEVGQSTSVKFDISADAGVAAPSDDWTKITLPEVKAPAKATHGRVLVTTWCTDEKGGGCALFDDVGIKELPATP